MDKLVNIFGILGVLMIGFCVRADINGWTVTVVLERGYRGIVPCPSIESQDTTVEEGRNVYWYFSGNKPENLLVSFYQGSITMYNGIPEGVYGIDDACSLVIENVDDSNWGEYYVQLEPRYGDAQQGFVIVQDLFLVNNTFTSTSLLQLSSTSENERYRCEANGVALGDRDGSHVTVVFRIKHPADDQVVPWMWVFLPLSVVAAVVMAVFLLRRRYVCRTAPKQDEDMPLIDEMNVIKLQNDLKTFYKDNMKTMPVNFGTEDLPSDECFTDLELRKDNKILKTLEDFLSLVGEDNTHLLVSGPVGCGKTTMARRIGYVWATNQSRCLSKFSLVFILNMRDMKDSSGLLYAIREQILPKNEVIEKFNLLEIIDEAVGKILIILDGFDEVNLTTLDKPETNNDISVKKVLAGKASTKINLIVTTRPHMTHAIYCLKEYIFYTGIKMTGFNAENRDEYISRRHLTDVIKTNRLIQELNLLSSEDTVITPIVLNVLCFMCDQSEIPKLITGLYRRVNDTLMAHRLKKYNLYLSTEFQLMKEFQLELGKLALRGLTDKCLKLSADEFSEQTLKYGLELGVLSQDIAFTGPVKFIDYPETRFQSFCAGRYVANMTQSQIDEQLLSRVTMIDNNAEDLEYLLRFSCGMNHKTALMILQHLNKMLKNHTNSKLLALALKLCWEAQTDGIDPVFGDTLKLKSPDDCQAFRDYLLKKIPSVSADLNASIRLHSLHIVVDDMAEHGDVLKAILERVVSRFVAFVIVNPENIGNVLKVLNHVISKVDNYNTRMKRSRLRLGDTVSIRSSLHVNSYSNQDSDNYEHCLQQLADFYQKRFQQGHQFGMDVDCDIINTHLATLVDILTQSKAVWFGVLYQSMHGRLKCLSSLIPSLRSLQFVECELTSDDLDDLANLLQSAQQLYYVNIDGGQFTENSINSLLVGLKKCPGVKWLKLEDTGLKPSVIRSAVMSHFGDSVKYDDDKHQFKLSLRKK